MKSVVIIGASHAAAEAISSLRKNGWQDKIVLIGDEASLPYQRPPLSKGYYKGEVDTEKLLLKKQQFYDDAYVDLFLGRTAESIDRDSKQIVLDGDEKIPYDKLIIATGTRARVLQLEGADLPNIHYLRTITDVDDIKEKVISGSKLLIVGAGYIGLEVAASAVKQGVDVFVLETMDRVLARVTSPVVSEFYQQLHKDQGVDIRLESSLVKFNEGENGSYAVLSSGEEIKFDAAIVGIGVIPNSEIAEAAGLDCDNGIIVDEFTCTNDPDIYAVGDCSNHPSFIYDRRIRLESVPNAVAQAKTAALAICADAFRYDQVPWFWSDQYDVKLQTAGLLTGYDTAIVRGDVNTNKFSVFYLFNGKLLAVDAINSPAEFMIAKRLIVAGKQLDVDKIQDQDMPIKELLG